MHMYPGHRLADVMAMAAVHFFSLLNEAYRIKYETALLTAQIGDLPAMDNEQRQDLYRQLQWASMHASDILNSDADEGASPGEIKKLLGG